MTFRRIPLLLAATFLLFNGPASADSELHVVTSIKPVHSLASAIMAGVGEPFLVIRGASPHAFTIRPSAAAALQEADVIFLIADGLETPLVGPIESLAAAARVVRLAEAPGLILKPLRSGGTFEEDSHHDHGHGAGHEDDHDDEEEHAGHDHDAHEDDHDDHAHGAGHEDDHADEEEHAGHDDHAHEDDHDDHAHGAGHDDDHADEEDHAGHDDHAHEDAHAGHDDGAIDLHVWLDPMNGRAMARKMAAVLAESDPSNAPAYFTNLVSLLERLDGATDGIAADLEPARGVPFLVFHDGYRYFEDQFGLTAAGSAVVHAGTSPGVKRVRELRDKIIDLGVVCVFSEPGINQRFVDTLIEGTDVRVGTVDPIGAEIEEGPDMYFTLLHRMAASFRDCLVSG